MLKEADVARDMEPIPNTTQATLPYTTIEPSPGSFESLQQCTPL